VSKKNNYKHKVKQLQPKADYINHVIASDSLIDVGQASKVLELPYGRNTFFKKLRECGIFFNNRNEPKQQYIESGWFKLKEQVIEKEHGSFVHLKVLVTQKGLAWLAKKFNAVIPNNQLTKVV
jgi:anti-repressor protein